MISKRLKSIAGLIKENDNVADIGCDHGLLGIYLIKSKRLNNIIISDINSKALKQAKKNVNKYKLKDKIEIKQGNGLEVINKNIDTITISGLGTSTIIRILNHDNLNQINKLIIQSNNDHYFLRRFLILKGFYISHESLVYEKGRYYINIVFKRGKKKYSLKELMYGPILMDANKDYYQFLLKKKEAIIDNIPKYKIITKLKHQKERRLLKKISKNKNSSN